MAYIDFESNPSFKSDLLKCNNVILLGKLAVGEEYYPGGLNNEPITPMKNGTSIMFYIKVLSDEPQPLARLSQENDRNIYIGLDNDQLSFIINDISYPMKSEQDKIDFWYNKLNDKLVLFKAKIKIKNNQCYLNLEIQSIEADNPNFLDPYFMCIPKNNMERYSFEDKLLSGSYITLQEYSHFYHSNPAYIRCGDYLYFNFQGWERYSGNNYAWRVSKNPEKIMRIHCSLIEEELSDFIVGGTPNIDFINGYGEMLLDEKIHQYGELLIEEEAISPLNTNQRQSTISSSCKNDLSKGEKSTGISNNLNISNVTKEFSSENDFLRELKAITLKENLNYNISDLVNFHISVKTNPLTVVAGMSGTGKTQLAYSYAKVLGLSEEDSRLLFLPINPSYLEPADVLGYLNTATGLYVPSETGLVDLLFSAEQNPDKLYMVIFDEMNLSQVEHWFAPFLSLLELDAERRWLRLYSKDCQCHNNHKYKSKVNIGDNVIFVGTVNLDETTKEFSDRLLDRVNVVTLQKGRFSQIQLEKNENHKDRTFDYVEFKSWISDVPAMAAFNETELLFFDNLHDVINQFDHQKGVSYRFLNRLGTYINNIPNCPENLYTLNKIEALDLGIRQRLLTKIKGSERQFGTLLGTTSSPQEEPINSALLEFFGGDDVKSIGSFEWSEKEIKRKALELGIYGYTS